MSERLQNGAQTSIQVGNYNTYVGARYVPLIDGEWDANKNYEPLTIVINQGNSYTSAQYVPKGVPLQDNGPYWFKTGNFNGQISGIENKVNINTQDIGNLVNITDNLKQDVNSVDKYNDNYYLFLGDSYGVGTSSQNGWCYYINNTLGITSDKAQSIAYGGARFVNDGSGQRTYTQMLSEVNSELIDKIEYVVLQTAGNDTSEYNTFIQAAGLFASNCRTKFPKLKKIIIFPMFWKPYYDNLNSTHLQYLQYLTQSNSFVVPNNVAAMCHYNKLRLPNDQHWTSDGSALIAYNMSNYLKGSDSVLYKGSMSYEGSGAAAGLIIQSFLSTSDVTIQIYGVMNTPTEVNGNEATVNLGRIEAGSTTYFHPNRNYRIFGQVGEYAGYISFNNQQNMILHLLTTSPPSNLSVARACFVGTFPVTVA